jgi:hypothetical protein
MLDGEVVGLDQMWLGWLGFPIITATYQVETNLSMQTMETSI